MRVPNLILVLMLIALLRSSPVYSGDKLCFSEASNRYKVPTILLQAIAWRESSGRLGLVTRNTNKTYDVSPMGINSLWKNVLPVETWQNIMNPCVNVNVGAWVLAQCFSEYGYTWKGVGCYHSRTPSRNAWYANEIHKIIELWKRQGIPKIIKEEGYD